VSYVLKIVRPANIQSFVAANAPASLKPTGRESWRAYLAANSGTGQTIGDLERSFLKAAAISGSTNSEAWGNKTSGTSGGTGREKVRNTYR
jgi:hypothetical protein